MRSVCATTQIIVSTQSVTLLDELAEPEEVIVVERKDKESTFSRLDPEALKAWLEEYTLGELWQKSVLGGVQVLRGVAREDRGSLATGAAPSAADAGALQRVGACGSACSGALERSAG